MIGSYVGEGFEESLHDEPVRIYENIQSIGCYRIAAELPQNSDKISIIYALKPCESPAKSAERSVETS